MTTFTGIFCGVVGLVGLIKAIENYRERKAEQEMYESQTSQSNDMATENETENNQKENQTERRTAGLMCKALEQFGCQPQMEQDGSLSVSYQGENFHMEFGGLYVRVWDPFWSGIKADDPMLPNVREAMNTANYSFGPTIVMTDPDDKGVISFHSRRDIMLHPACPDNVHYVKAVLDSFFTAKETMRQNFHEINMKQADAKKNRRPVGFTTNINTETTSEEK